jgi:hypothetical protein
MSHAYVLYVNESYSQPESLCAGSQRCLEALGERDEVLVQNVAQILGEGIELPPWLDATPCFVDVATSTAHKGSHAVEACRQLPHAQAAAAPAAPVDLGDMNSELSNKVTDADVDRIIEERKQQDEKMMARLPGPKPVTIAASEA